MTREQRDDQGPEAANVWAQQLCVRAGVVVLCYLQTMPPPAVSAPPSAQQLTLFPPAQGDRIGRLRPLRCRMIPRATRPILKTSSKQTLGYRLAFQI